MARPAATYRAARRNAARGRGKDFLPLDGSRQTMKPSERTARWQTAAPKYRPVQPQGWDWRNGGRRERDATRTPEFAAMAKEMGHTVRSFLRFCLVGNAA